MKETTLPIPMNVWPLVKFSEKTNWRLWVIRLKYKTDSFRNQYAGLSSYLH